MIARCTPAKQTAAAKRMGRAVAMAGLLVSASIFGGQAIAEVPKEFSYQAQVLDTDTGQPLASTDVTISIRVYPGQLAGVPILTQTYPNLDLSNTDGYVNLQVDASTLNLDQELWLEVTVDDNTDLDPAEALRPRQKIGSVPYALNSERLGDESLDQLKLFATNEALAAEARANDYTDLAIANILPGGTTKDYVEGVLDNFHRIIYVNPAITQNAAPNGGIYDPFDNIGDAYAFARTLPNAGDFFQRVAIYLMPGQYDVTTTVDMDTAGIDLLGYANKTAFIQGTADPLLRFSAPASGAVVRNLQIRPTGAANIGLEILTGGRVDDVEFARVGFPTNGGDLIRINTPNGPADNYAISLQDVEIYGGIEVLSYGDATVIEDGFIRGRLHSTATVGASFNEYLALNDLTTVGQLEFMPASSVGIITLNNVGTVGSVNYTTMTVIRSVNTNFVNTTTFSPLILPNPSVGSRVVNAVARFPVGGWTGTVTQSPGNISGYIAYAAK